MDPSRDITSLERIAAFAIKAETLAAGQPVRIFDADDLDQVSKAAEAGRNLVGKIQKVVVMQRTIEFRCEDDRRRRSQRFFSPAMGHKACCRVRPQQAIERFIRDAGTTSEWAAAVASDDATLVAAELLQKAFDWPEPDDLEEGAVSPERLIETLVEKAVVRHKQHVGKSAFFNDAQFPRIRVPFS